MASPHSVESNEVLSLSLTEHIAQLSKAIDANIKLCKVISEARGNGTLKPGKKIKLADGREVGVEDLQTYTSKIKSSLKAIPRIVSNEKKAELERKRARHANRETQAIPPSQYTADLVSFFNSADLGKTKDGRRLQDHPSMALFFKNGVGSNTFGVSLFNVWGNIYKLKHNSFDIVLDAQGLRALSGAVDTLKQKKREIIASADADPAVRAKAQVDLERLEANKIHNKDYMTILSFYHVKDSSADLTPYTQAVADMSTITKELNAEYGLRVKESRAATKTTAPKAAAAPAAAPVPAMPSLKTLPSLPATIPTVARGSSPTGKRR